VTDRLASWKAERPGERPGRLAAIDAAIRRLLPRKRALRSAGRGRGFSIAESDEYDALQAEIDALELEESALLLADDPANRSCSASRAPGCSASDERPGERPAEEE